MTKAEVILRFEEVSFEYGHQKPILNGVSFSVREGSKITLMGQNGAGKSTIFQLITGELKPEAGQVIISKNMSIAAGKQVIPRGELKYSVREFFERAFANPVNPEARPEHKTRKIYDLEPRIQKVLEAVNVEAPLNRLLESFSGGQQARLLLARALIQNPDILLLDEPTNNLDKAGIEHLTKFLQDYPKTCLVISHDAGFLNSFTDGVLYLDSFTKKVEQYHGNYFTVVEEIKARLERERMLNVRLIKDISHRKEQANYFAQKGGHLRDVAKKMRDKVETLSEEIVDVRREDKTIRPFTIPCQEDLSGKIVTLTSITLMRENKVISRPVKIILKKKEHLLLSGPNGIGKTTLLEQLATGHAKGESIPPGVKIGYYRQDFSTLNFEETPYETLARAMDDHGTEQDLRSRAAGFLITAEMLKTKIGLLSEGQKGLVAFAALSFMKPGLLILDEPTNHINFRHVPVIAAALDKYEGAMILVSHVPDFVAKIRIDQTVDLGSI